MSLSTLMFFPFFLRPALCLCFRCRCGPGCHGACAGVSASVRCLCRPTRWCASALAVGSSLTIGTRSSPLGCPDSVARATGFASVSARPGTTIPGSVPGCSSAPSSDPFRDIPRHHPRIRSRMCFDGKSLPFLFFFFCFRCSLSWATSGATPRKHATSANRSRHPFISPALNSIRFRSLVQAHGHSRPVPLTTRPVARGTPRLPTRSCSTHLRRH